jgi:hypothetical protein
MEEYQGWTKDLFFIDKKGLSRYSSWTKNITQNQKEFFVLLK